MEEVIKRANDTSYGLAAGILTNDVSKALTFSSSVNAGTVWYGLCPYPFERIDHYIFFFFFTLRFYRVNCFLHIAAQTPFGGFKQSGIGREM